MTSSSRTIKEDSNSKEGLKKQRKGKLNVVKKEGKSKTPQGFYT